MSRLVMGTAQFGLPGYGIANRTGRPSFEQVCQMVQTAYDGGVRTIDTAAEYGDAESVVGRALAETGLQMTVITKVRPTRGMERDGWTGNAKGYIRWSVEQSLVNLRLDTLPLCLLHDADDIVYYHVLLRLQEEGLIRAAGVSVYRPYQLETVLSLSDVAAIQVSANVLDQRALRTGYLARVAKAGIDVYVRSVYLQGLVTMQPEDVPAGLRATVPVLGALRKLASEHGLTIVNMAMRYALSLNGVTGVVVGAETVEQVEDNLEMAEQGVLPRRLMRSIGDAVPDLPERILYPRYWE